MCLISHWYLNFHDIYMFIKCKLAQNQKSSFSNPGPPRCYEQGIISAIL